jgi:hypothetical protein
VPQAVFPDSVFKAVVKIPYDTSIQQVAGDGSRAGLNVGAVVILPDGFKLAPADRLSDELKEETAACTSPSGVTTSPTSCWWARSRAISTRRSSSRSFLRSRQR